MKNIVLFSLAIILLSSCAKNTLPTYPAHWTSNWPNGNKPAQYDSLSKVYYEAQRDESNVYLHLSTQEMASQMKIMRYGMTIWLDQTAKKKSLVGFSYPQPAPDSIAGRGFGGSGGRGEGAGRGEGNKGEGGGQAPKPEQMQQRMLQRIYKRFNERPKELVQIGFETAGKKKTYLLGKDISDIQVEVEIEEDNTMHYYAVVPIKKIFSNSKYKGDLLSIGIVSGYLQTEEGGGMPNMGGGGPPPAAEGGGNSERRAFMMKMMEQMTKPIEIWFNADLNTKKN